MVPKDRATCAYGRYPNPQIVNNPFRKHSVIHIKSQKYHERKIFDVRIHTKGFTALDTALRTMKANMKR